MDTERQRHIIAKAYDTVPFYNNIYNDNEINISNSNLPED